jgi:formylglycine-generating enzyme required for sulfatase activity
VQFDVSWSNSWRSAVNWDAAWVFVKFQAPGSNNWQHATLSTNSADHLAAAGSVVSATRDGAGVFIYRSDLATGGVSFSRMRVKWNYGASGYSFVHGAPVNVSVHAIEMVYIPQSAFYAGSGGTETGHFFPYPETNSPYLVTNENAIDVGVADGNLFYTNTTYDGDQAGPIPELFPKGYNAFYCMKYEISQGQYVDFLNELTAGQCSNRYSSSSSGSRYTISGSYTNYTCTAPDRACNFLSWADGCAYAAWAGLRPMTELEYEKACRGPATPVPNEYAWGSTNISGTSALVADGTGADTAVGGNCNYDPCSPDGPYRVGIYATASSSRQDAGAGYYGAMELSGSLWERCITVGSSNGRNFTGTHGNGVLDASGSATNSDWLAGVSSVAGLRGGNWTVGSSSARVSDRNSAAYVSAARIGNYGWRAVRLAP